MRVACRLARSEGSVIAYYFSEFKVPSDQVAALDSAMSSLGSLVDKNQRMSPSDRLILEDVTTSGGQRTHTLLLLLCWTCLTRLFRACSDRRSHVAQR